MDERSTIPKPSRLIRIFDFENPHAEQDIHGDWKFAIYD